MTFELDKNSYSRYLGRSFHLLAELTHSELDDIYLINDSQDLTLEGKTYQAFPFDIILPSQSEKQGTQLVLSNIQQLVTQELIKIIKSNENIICKVYVCNRESGTAEKYDKGTYEVMAANVEQDNVGLTINLRHSLDYNAGTIRYNQQLFKNLYL